MRTFVWVTFILVCAFYMVYMTTATYKYSQRLLRDVYMTGCKQGVCIDDNCGIRSEATSLENADKYCAERWGMDQ